MISRMFSFMHIFFLGVTIKLINIFNNILDWCDSNYEH